MAEKKIAKGTIFDISRYAIHDGPGIRATVFFKGCPLRCQWCHNPEGQESKPEIIVKAEKCPADCEQCLSICPKAAISKNGRSITVDREKCDSCGKCKDVCVYEALDIIGREVTVQDVLKEVEKDRIFFDESGGGVTISGGEPLMQPDFLEALLKGFKKRGIRTTVDTSGFASFEILDRISDHVDLFLYDLKLMDPKKHKEYSGVSNEIILENLKRLSEKGKKVIVRIPVIPGVNDDGENMKRIADYLLSLKNIKQINLLPFHRGGIQKYKRLGKKNLTEFLQPPSNDKMKEIKKIFIDSGFMIEKER
jgi:pyruvate formate lyase activating enzyme